VSINKKDYESPNRFGNSECARLPAPDAKLMAGRDFGLKRKNTISQTHRIQTMNDEILSLRFKN